MCNFLDSTFYLLLALTYSHGSSVSDRSKPFRMTLAKPFENGLLRLNYYVKLMKTKIQFNSKCSFDFAFRKFSTKVVFNLLFMWHFWFFESLMLEFGPHQSPANGFNIKTIPNINSMWSFINKVKMLGAFHYRHVELNCV